MNEQLKASEKLLKDAEKNLQLCRDMIEEWRAKEKQAFKDWLEMEKAVTELRVREQLKGKI